MIFSFIIFRSLSDANAISRCCPISSSGSYPNIDKKDKFTSWISPLSWRTMPSNVRFDNCLNRSSVLIRFSVNMLLRKESQVKKPSAIVEKSIMILSMRNKGLILL